MQEILFLPIISVLQAQAVENSGTAISFDIEDFYSNIDTAFGNGVLPAADLTLAVAESLADAKELSAGTTGGSVEVDNFAMAAAVNFTDMDVAEFEAVTDATNFETIKSQISIQDDVAQINAKLDFIDGKSFPRPRFTPQIYRSPRPKQLTQTIILAVLPRRLKLFDVVGEYTLSDYATAPTFNTIDGALAARGATNAPEIGDISIKLNVSEA